MSHYYFENLPHGRRKNGTKLNTKLHHDYICRKDNYAQIKGREAESVVLTASGNLPDWADKAGDFWEKAEQYRGVNGRAYREFKFALQEELTMAENIECIEELIQKTGIKDNHVYSYAVHDKAAAFDKGHNNTHCHLMFNEKIIERDRPLGAEQYFKNYSERNGRPAGGYRSSREFVSKAKNKELRRLYADIVNAKFREKGLDCRIDERTLEAQRDELLEQGREKEAMLYDREPSPHLGNAYKNPAIMSKILMKIDETDDKAEAEADGFFVPDEDVNAMSESDKKIALFANDVILRRIAREIQLERSRLKKEQADEKARYDAIEIENEAMVITVHDIYDYAADKVKVYEADAAEKLQAYKKAKAAVVTDKQLDFAAKNLLTSGDYGRHSKEYYNVVQELKKVESVLPTLYGRKDKTAELAKNSRRLRELKSQRVDIGKKLAEYNAVFKNNPEQFDAAKQQVDTDNKRRQAALKPLYRAYAMAEKNVQKYKDVMAKMAAENMDAIIFADKLPKQLNHKNKLNGITAIGNLPVTVDKGRVFAMMEDMPKDRPPSVIIKSVRINDDIREGKVPIYKLHFTKTADDKYSLNKIYSSDEKAYLYKPKSDARPQMKTARPHPFVKQAQHNRNQHIASRIAKIADTFANDKMRSVKARWQEEDFTKDKVKQAEKQMYSGWSL